MSSFITISINNVAEKHTVSKKLMDVATRAGVGVFFENRYMEQFEKNIIAENPDAFFFDLADTMEFDNCEELVSGYWTDQEGFHSRMKKVESFVNTCFEFSESIDLWVGTSGDQDDDFTNREIKIDEFFSAMQKSYEESSEKYHFIPPSVHFRIKRGDG